MNKDNKKFIIETLFLKGTLKYDLTINEFLVLMYFDNDQDLTFDVKKVSKSICLDETSVLNAFSSLIEKGLITMISTKNDAGKMVDKISLDNLYKGINDSNAKEKKAKEVEDFFTKFQKKYGHSLSSMDYEIINAWLDKTSEELVLGALDDAIYNGVVTIKYIDAILYNWNKKGFKTMNDVNNNLAKESEEEEDDKQFETSIFNYDWLDEEEEFN